MTEDLQNVRMLPSKGMAAPLPDDGTPKKFDDITDQDRELGIKVFYVLEVECDNGSGTISTPAYRGIYPGVQENHPNYLKLKNLISEAYTQQRNAAKEIFSATNNPPLADVALDADTTLGFDVRGLHGNNRFTLIRSLVGIEKFAEIQLETGVMKRQRSATQSAAKPTPKAPPLEETEKDKNPPPRPFP